MKEEEHILQKRCVTWFTYQYPHLRQLLFAVPNGGYRPRITAAKMKSEGITAGVADLILQIPNYYYHSLNIEMKAGARQSETQKLYEIYCKSAGNYYTICRSIEEFQEVINNYLSTVDTNILSALRDIYSAQKEAETVKARKKFQMLISKTNKKNETE